MKLFVSICFLALATLAFAGNLPRKEYPRAKGLKLPPGFDPSKLSTNWLGVADRYEVEQLPENFDARKGFPECADVIGRIGDQAQCGSCWAFATAYTISDRICVASKGAQKPYISAQDVLECTSGQLGCGGGEPIAAWNNYVKNGVVTGGLYHSNQGCKPYLFPCNIEEKNCPYVSGLELSCLNICENYFDPKFHPETLEEQEQAYKHDKHYGSSIGTITYVNATNRDYIDNIKLQIFKHGSVGAVIAADNGFTEAAMSNTIYSNDLDYHSVDHAVRIIGWGVENGVNYWLIANSWGTAWGVAGGTVKVQQGKAQIEYSIVFGVPKL